jgi:hypothetical protein
MGVRGQRHAPAALPPGKRPGTQRTRGWVGPRAGLDGCGKLRPPPGLDPRAVQPVGSRYTDYAIPAHSVDGRWMKCEYGAWQRGKKPVLCHFIHHKTHTQWPVGTNRLHHGTVPLFRWLSQYLHIIIFLVLNIRNYSWVFKEHTGIATFSELFLLSMTCLLSKGFTCPNAYNCAQYNSRD